ncbi:ultra-long-chain fatty acid omega-hydroxylase-like [Physella acuta]|uniref:ultra-long-chain fatty acid omega-hydroxylase-like n=1 Tax=Physella acuta TaxID=109671 RepID=UPI0027DBA76F|nr:ultra-long-chain fatty acid omega-hydroxylase-like [Physella acuta]XP_059153440.1 ultra-long-chain fatty acid omega-hydroxylase-like [Physella acuta]
MLLLYVAIAVVTFVVVRYVRRNIQYRKLFFQLPIAADYRYTTGTLHAFPGNNEEGMAFNFVKAQKNCYCHVEWIGPVTPVIVAYHPESIRPILKSSAAKSRGSILSTPYDMGLRWLGEGLLISNGGKWARSRRLLTPAFHFDILKQYVDIYNTCADIMLNKMQKLSKKKEPFDIYSLINLDALDVILRCAFSYQSNCQLDESVNSYSAAIGELQALWADRAIKPRYHIEFLYSFTEHGRKFYKLCDVAHAVAEEIIAKRKKELESSSVQVSNRKVKDFLDTLLTARDEDGNGMTALEIRNEVDTFLFEGHDTTASGMTWTLYELAKHPEHQERIYDEVKDVLDGREHLDWNDLPKLEFTTMCIKEGLRLHSAVPFIERTTVEECEINGHVLPPGTRVAIQLWILHHNPHIWEDPHVYNPERFHPDNQANMDPFQFLPFSAGSRNCIGQNFAMNEMKTTIARIISKFKLSVDQKNEVRRVPIVTMKPENKVLLFASARD